MEKEKWFFMGEVEDKEMEVLVNRGMVKVYDGTQPTIRRISQGIGDAPGMWEYRDGQEWKTILDENERRRLDGATQGT